MTVPPRVLKLLLVMAVLATGGTPASAQPTESFEAYLDKVKPRALAAGVSEETYRRVVSGITFDPAVPRYISGQPEFTTPVWEYLDVRVSPARIARGREAVARNRALLDAVGARYGIDPFVLAAIWGMESDYGGILGNSTYVRPVVSSLATLAHQRRIRRGDTDENEFIAALRLIETDHWTEQTLVGSWAGAIGHTQLIVSGLIAHGTDWDGDGRVDPHASLGDALASTAAFLRDAGYVAGSDWGYEVDVPDGFDYLLATRDALRPVSFFAARGVTRVAGRAFADPDQPVFLYVPTGRNGPKFLMTANYLVFKAYNLSDSYALAIGHLADRLKGSGHLVNAWPTSTRFPNREQRIVIQQKLKALGLFNGPTDGLVGPITQAAYQKFQASRGEIADGFITYDTFVRLSEAVP